MQKLSEIDRKTLILTYIQGEVVKKNKPLPATLDSVDWDDVNAINPWLRAHGYKAGIISGFRRWAYCKLDLEDLLNLAIVGHIFPDSSQKIGHHVPDNPHDPWDHRDIRLSRNYRDPPPPWFEPLSRGEFREEFAIIVRPTVKGERRWGAHLYVEDGGGRTLYYTKGILRHNRPSELTAYIGFDVDTNSQWLQQNFRGELIRNAHRYTTFEKLLKSMRPTLIDKIRTQIRLRHARTG
jgi:hypothetical protein